MHEGVFGEAERYVASWVGGRMPDVGYYFPYFLGIISLHRLLKVDCSSIFTFCAAWASATMVPREDIEVLILIKLINTKVQSDIL